MQMKTFRYRLYPSKSQAKFLRLNLDAARNWYNMALAEIKFAYQLEGRKVAIYTVEKLISKFKGAFRKFQFVHTHVLQVATEDLGEALQSFFRRVKAGQGKPGYPRFKAYNRFNSFGFKEDGNGFSFKKGKLRISNVGRVSVRMHRPIEGKIKTCRIKLIAGQWYLTFVCEVPDPIKLPSAQHDIGIDLNIENLLTDSEGNRVESPKYYRQAQADLRLAQRDLQRKTKGSKNRQKSLIRLQRAHLKVKNKRQDALNKVVYLYIQHNDFIALEDLQTANMVRNKKLSKSILDQGWGYLKAKFFSKALNAGREVVLVDPAYTSKDCSHCDREFENFDLSVRWVVCKHCGLRLARDHNAAINIIKRAIPGWVTTLQLNVEPLPNPSGLS